MSVTNKVIENYYKIVNAQCSMEYDVEAAENEFSDAPALMYSDLLRVLVTP